MVRLELDQIANRRFGGCRYSVVDSQRLTFPNSYCLQSPTVNYKEASTMPVDLRTHDPSDDVQINPRTNKAAIIRLLYTNPNYGFTPSEIHNRLDDIPKGSITGTLTRLLNDGYIGKTADGYYHAVESRDDLRRFARGLVQVQTLTDRYDDDFTPDDIEQTDDHPTDNTHSETRQHSSANEEPAPEDWIESVDDSEQA